MARGGEEVAKYRIGMWLKHRNPRSNYPSRRRKIVDIVDGDYEICYPDDGVQRHRCPITYIEAVYVPDKDFFQALHDIVENRED